MKLIFKFVFLLSVMAFPVFGQGPHLMLYFDINKTLIASDRAGGKSMDDVLNQLLADKFQFCWDPSLQEPISYDSYVRNVLLPGPEHDLELKNKRNAHLNHFIDHLHVQNHSIYPEVLSTYDTTLKKLQSAQGIVFPSFYRLLADLDRREISYTIILRSFGEEVFEIAEEINMTYKSMFNHFGVFNQGTLHLDKQKKLSYPFEIYETLCSLSHVAIRDDWEYWMKEEMSSQFGKPFFLDQEDKTILGIFFDDNIKLDGRETNIIAPKDAKTGEPIAIAELAGLHQLICVDTLEAIINDDYFVDLVQNAMDKNQLGAPNS